MVVEMLGKDYKRLGFYNIYLGDAKQYQYPEAVYILFKPRFTKEYTDYEKELATHPEYIKRYDIASKFTMHVFHIPKEYIADYHVFINGEYTKFTPEYKSKFKQGSRVYDVVQGHLNYPKWKENLEIFNLKLITNNTKNGKKNNKNTIER
jgi:hypothetical protein